MLCWSLINRVPTLGAVGAERVNDEMKNRQISVYQNIRLYTRVFPIKIQSHVYTLEYGCFVAESEIIGKFAFCVKMSVCAIICVFCRFFLLGVFFFFSFSVSI